MENKFFKLSWTHISFLIFFLGLFLTLSTLHLELSSAGNTGFMFLVGIIWCIIVAQDINPPPPYNLIYNNSPINIAIFWFIGLFFLGGLAYKQETKNIVNHGLDHHTNKSSVCMYYDEDNGYITKDTSFVWVPYLLPSKIRRERIYKQYSWKKNWYYVFNGVSYTIPIQGTVDIIAFDKFFYNQVISPAREKDTQAREYEREVHTYLKSIVMREIANTIHMTLKREAETHNLSPHSVISLIEQTTVEVLKDYPVFSYHPQSCAVKSENINFGKF